MNINLEVGDRAMEGLAYRNLSVVYRRLGQLDKSAEFQQKYERLK